MSFAPEIVLGPPGTGKTTTLLNLVDDELSSGTPPERIGYVSFTRKAANEAVERAVEKFDLDRGRFEWFRTLHALCYRRLALSNASVFVGNRTLEDFSQYAGVRLSGRYNLAEGNMSGYEKGDRILFMEVLSRIRETSVREEYIESGENIPWHEVERVIKAYHTYKSHHGLLDFNDILEEFVNRGVPPQLDVLFVDEAQDLSLLQWRVVQLLAETCRRVVVAGDDDQAIYRWAGAAVDHFVDLPGEQTVLGQSYRVPQVIQGMADSIISTVRHRRDKEWNPRDALGAVTQNIRMPQDVLTDSPDVLILVRNDFVIKNIVDPALRTLGVFYQRGDYTSVRAGVRQAILSWERLRSGTSVPISEVKKVYEYMTSRVGVARGHKNLPAFPDDGEMVSMAHLVEKGGLLVESIWHEAFDRLSEMDRSYILSMRMRDEKLNRAPRITVSTIHAAKGGQADDVILFDKMARMSYEDMQRRPDDEARVWYVAVTRARERLHLVETRSDLRYRGLG